MSSFISPAVPAQEYVPSENERTYATFIHLSGFLSYLAGPLALIVTLVLWLARRDDSQFINDHGREAMNYNISIWLYALLFTLLTFVVIGFCFLGALVVFDVVIMIIAAVCANRGDYFRYPITIRFIPS